MPKNCVLFALALMSAGACVGQSKSANPLSPAIAGPIAGVDITAPAVMAPAVDAIIDTTTQPITLKVSNATSNSVRPLSYLFEIATDPGFTNKVVAQDAVPQGDGATSFTLPTSLAAERKYYWHARAGDGANVGPFGGTSAFHVVTPVIFGVPTLVAPINDADAGTTQPRFVWANASHSGPVGRIFYSIELNRSAIFDAATTLASWLVLETPGQTELVSPVGLSAGQYFWRARAHDDGGRTGPYSAIQTFRTSGSTGGGGGGGAISPSGNWEDCGSTPGPDVVICVEDAINPAHTVEGAFEVTKRVAWLLRGHGYGLLRKDGGENIVTWNGTSFAAARIVLPNGNFFKLLSDVPTTNGPGWHDEGIDPGLISRWISPMQP